MLKGSYVSCGVVVATVQTKACGNVMLLVQLRSAHRPKPSLWHSLRRRFIHPNHCFLTIIDTRNPFPISHQVRSDQTSRELQGG